MVTHIYQETIYQRVVVKILWSYTVVEIIVIPIGTMVTWVLSSQLLGLQLVVYISTEQKWLYHHHMKHNIPGKYYQSLVVIYSYWNCILPKGAKDHWVHFYSIWGHF